MVVLDSYHVVKGKKINSNPTPQNKEQRRIPTFMHRQERQNVYSSNHPRDEQSTAE